jgi:hypothetical protein
MGSVTMMPRSLIKTCLPPISVYGGLKMTDENLAALRKVRISRFKEELTVRFHELPPDIVRAWIQGEIENLRYDKASERYSFRVSRRQEESK